MGAEVYVFKRDKTDGYYQNDLKCECVGKFGGWAAYDYIMDEVHSHFSVEGSAVLSSENDMGTILSNKDEYCAYWAKNRKADRNGLFFQKYQFIYRVEKPFFKALVNREEYKYWSQVNDFPLEKQWLKEQLTKFCKVIRTFDFEKNYYYIVESV